MRIIDARTGAEVKVGGTVDYGDGDGWTLLKVDEGIFRASALVRRQRPFVVRHRHGETLATDHWVPLTVRYLHPNFMFQKVGFFPS